LGYPQEVELERDENAIYELIHPEERDNLFGEIQRAIQRHKRGLTYRYRVRHVDGHYIWREDNARFVYDEQGRHLHSYVVCRDITQRKRIEEEMERARQEAVEANKAKSRFLASMSHEIRTPMNAIMGMTDMALMTPDEGEQHEHLLTVKESAHHLMGIINDVLDISKVEAGRMQLERKPFSLHHALETVYRIFLGEIKYKGLDFTLYLDPQLPDYVVCDEVRLRQVVANLVSNARKFTDAGKIELNVYLLERLEAADAKQGEDLARIAIEVADTGIGIPKHRQKDIFSMFEQADSSTTRRYGGTGLGLSISKQLVDLMGGEITVASEPAHGSTFHIELPLPIFKGSVPKHSGAGKGREASEVHQLQDSTYVAEKPNDSGASAGEGGPWHILLAEDNRVNVKLARRVLQKMGHSVTVVYDGRQVINELYQRGQEFQLILMDIEMPEMDGIEATQRIRRGEAGEGSKSIKIIAMTAHAVADIQDRALNAGMDGYITKPVDITKLQSSMEEIFSRRS
jgi:PAS domain S-box-containing protein